MLASRDVGMVADEQAASTSAAADIDARRSGRVRMVGESATLVGAVRAKHGTLSRDSTFLAVTGVLPGAPHTD